MGTERDRAGNRELHFDQYVGLVLLKCFNPMRTSLRGIVQEGQLKNVQKALGCKRTSLGPVSEAASVFDAECFKPIVANLGTRRYDCFGCGRSGNQLELWADVFEIRRFAKHGFTLRISTGNGSAEEISGSAVIWSMPITEFVKKLEPPPPAEVLEAADRLTYRDFLIVCLIVDRLEVFPDN